MPTHVQVTVQKAVDLITKGKNNTNDCFVTIALGKTKYQTSVKKKSEPSVEWHEECELPIPEQGNTAEIVLTVLHQNFMNVDEFLGRAIIPLNGLDTYERPKNKWFPLQGKPGKSEKPRGRLEAKIAFTVKSGSLTDLSKKEKHKSSIGSLSHMAQTVGGSLLSIGSADKRKGIKKIAKSIGSKMHLRGKKGHKDEDANSIGSGSLSNLRRHGVLLDNTSHSRQTYEDADPGVVSDEDEDFLFDDLSHKSSGSSLNTSQVPKITEEFMDKPTLPPSKPPRMEPKQDEWEMKLNKNKNSLKPSAAAENINRRSWESPKLSDRIEEEEDPHDLSQSLQEIPIEENILTSKTPNKTPELPHKEKEKEKLKESMFTKLRNLRKDKHEDKHDKHERVIIGGESELINSTSSNNRISNELLLKYEGKTREDLILLLNDTHSDLEHNKKKLKDLEDYLDELLLRVMETQPKILQNPYVNCKLAHKKWLESNDG